MNRELIFELEKLNAEYQRPHWVGVGFGLAVTIVALALTIAIVIGPLFGRGQAPAQSSGRMAKALESTTETISGNTVTTIRSGDFFTRIIRTAEGQSFIEEGYINAWGEYHVSDVSGGSMKR